MFHFEQRSEGEDDLVQTHQEEPEKDFPVFYSVPEAVQYCRAKEPKIKEHNIYDARLSGELQHTFNEFGKYIFEKNWLDDWLAKREKKREDIKLRIAAGEAGKVKRPYTKREPIIREEDPEPYAEKPERHLTSVPFIVHREAVELQEPESQYRAHPIALSDAPASPTSSLAAQMLALTQELQQVEDAIRKESEVAIHSEYTKVIAEAQQRLRAMQILLHDILSEIEALSAVFNKI